MAYTSFASWLEEQLKEQGISQAELARRAGVTRGAINNILQGERGPGVDLAKGIAKALSLPPEQVMKAAGLLPEDKKKSKEVEQAVHILEGMTKEEQQEYLSYLRFMQNRKKK